VAQLFHAEAEEGGAAGVVITVLLPASHLVLRTWPAQRGVTLDIYAAAGTGIPPDEARALVDMLATQFQPTWTEQRSLDRGDEQ
jgi:S-adenosylmethionine decarboxylase